MMGTEMQDGSTDGQLESSSRSPARSFHKGGTRSGLLAQPPTMKHIVAVGVCYLDTILGLRGSARGVVFSVPYFPEEDSKLRATSSQVRRGGNCGNTLEVLQQLLQGGEASGGGDISSGSSSKTGAVHTQLHLLSPLPDASSPAAAQILGSFESGGGGGCFIVGSDLCLHRVGMTLPASSYIIRSEATGSRTIVSQVPLAEMTKDEFAGAVAAFATSNSDETAQDQSWWHFEGRIPETTLWCIRHLRCVLPSATVSVEVEKPGREGLPELAAEADVVFYSKSPPWRRKGDGGTESRGYRGPEQCLRGEARSSHAYVNRITAIPLPCAVPTNPTSSSPPAGKRPAAPRGEREGERAKIWRAYGGVVDARGAFLVTRSRLFVTWGAEGASAFATHGRDYHCCAVKDVAAGDYRVVDNMAPGAPPSPCGRAGGDAGGGSTIGAGDTFIAGVIFDLFCRDGDEGRDLQDTLRFAVGLATRKVQIDGFGGLGGGGRAGCE
ncbi:hypothetical protein GGTG_00517 [Gaeumannomyces tritici R3-111a-1]|uniref:Carbohydrate kinase PfkB domain-containing protein n=1 Tax=Gaeumannomyces tritici (strain R3-111a-1) TaxID=644352 RepID=J3NGY1_GAET3|nr:hypothetical protein GGTG_00517 [Gaeumannomyces tritici R3-111a-1]EJT80521.1 hypothetical protein GGTG_00517 [Gaeumannomyces tritici R3-111a-1]